MGYMVPMHELQALYTLEISVKRTMIIPHLKNLKSKVDDFTDCFEWRIVEGAK